MEVNSLRSWELKWTIPYEQTASKANVQPACWFYFLCKAHNSLFNVNSTKMETYSLSCLKQTQSHKDTK